MELVQQTLSICVGRKTNTSKFIVKPAKTSLGTRPSEGDGEPANNYPDQKVDEVLIWSNVSRRDGKKEDAVIKQRAPATVHY